MEEHKPGFDLAVINPDIVIGPMLHPVPGPSSINETNKFAIYAFLDGTHKLIEPVTFPFYHFVGLPFPIPPSKTTLDLTTIYNRLMFEMSLRRMFSL